MSSSTKATLERSVFGYELTKPRNKDAAPYSMQNEKEVCPIMFLGEFMEKRTTIDDDIQSLSSLSDDDCLPRSYNKGDAFRRRRTKQLKPRSPKNNAIGSTTWVKPKGGSILCVTAFLDEKEIEEYVKRRDKRLQAIKAERNRATNQEFLQMESRDLLPSGRDVMTFQEDRH